MKRLAILLSALILAGCAAVEDGGGGHVSRQTATGTDAVRGVEAVFSWRAEGQMIFRCAYDDKGFFWEFVRPEGRLLDDKGRRQAVLQQSFGITARDGSSLSARIIEQGAESSPRNLRTVTFATRTSGPGMLSGIRLVVRRDAVGGMPLASCTASQRGHLLRVPFRARYVFYR